MTCNSIAVSTQKHLDTDKGMFGIGKKVRSFQYVVSTAKEYCCCCCSSLRKRLEEGQKDQRNKRHPEKQHKKLVEKETLMRPQWQIILPSALVITLSTEGNKKLFYNIVYGCLRSL